MHQNPQKDWRGRIIPPSSTDKTIIFPYNRSTDKFNSDHYSPAMTYGNGNLSTEEIQRFLGEIDCHVKPYFAFCGFRLKKILFCLGYALFALYFLSFFWSLLPIFFDMPSFLPYSPFLVGAALVSYLIPAGIICCICTSLGERKLEKVNQKVNLYINERAMDFKLRGLSWILPTYFPHWIELWKDDPNPNIQHQIQPVHMHNPNENHISRPGETVEIMQIHSQPVQPNKRGYYELNEEKL